MNLLHMQLINIVKSNLKIYQKILKLFKYKNYPILEKKININYSKSLFAISIKIIIFLYLFLFFDNNEFSI